MEQKKKRWLFVLLLVPILLSIWFLIQRHGVQRSQPQESRKVAPRGRPGSKWRNRLSGQNGRPDYVPLAQMLLPEAEQGQGHWLTGKVADEKGSPLPGATVSLLSGETGDRLSNIAMNSTPADWKWPTPLASAIADATGHYEINSDTPIQNRVIVQKEGFAAIDDPLVQGPETVVRNYRMWPAPSCIEGNIFDNASRPLSGAFVSAGPQSLARYFWNGSTILGNFQFTDGSGKFNLSSLPEGDSRIAASFRGFVHEQKEINLKAGPCAHVDFRLQAADMISFLVKNWRAYPIPNPRVETEFAVWTDEHGMVRIAAPVDSDPFQCVISAQGYQTKEVKIDPKAPPTSVFLDAADFLRGQVLDEANKPISGARVSALGTSVSSDYKVTGDGAAASVGLRMRSNGSTDTDSDGMFSLRVPFPPARSVTASKPGYKTELKQFEEGKFQPTFVEIRLHRAQSGIFGRVVDEAGNPVLRFVVLVYGYPDYMPGSTQSFDTEDGRFLVTDLPEGTYTIRVTSPMIADREYRSRELKLRNGYFYGAMLVSLTTPKPISKKWP